MKLRPLSLAAAAVLCLSGCNFLEAMRQTSPHRTDKPVFGSDAWKEKRQEARELEEWNAAQKEHEDAALALKILTNPDHQ